MASHVPGVSWHRRNPWEHAPTRIRSGPHRNGPLATSRVAFDTDHLIELAQADHGSAIVHESGRDRHHRASGGVLLAPPRCSDKNEYGTDDNSEDQDSQSDLHPDPEVPDCRLDSVPPRI